LVGLAVVGLAVGPLTFALVFAPALFALAVPVLTATPPLALPTVHGSVSTTS
jgi:hypothetical protein